MRNIENRQLAAMAARRSAVVTQARSPLSEDVFLLMHQCYSQVLQQMTRSFCTGGQRDFT